MTEAERERETGSLTFRPFAMLPADELQREERFWWNIVRANTSVSTSLIAERHRQRCLEFLRGDHLQGKE